MSSQVIAAVETNGALQRSALTHSAVLETPLAAQDDFPEVEEARQGCLRGIQVALALQGGGVLIACSAWMLWQWMWR